MVIKNFIALFIFVTTTTYATPSQSKSQKLLDIESQVWTARSDQLFDLENQIVRLMQENPDSAYAHYLLSHLYLEKFSQSPGDLTLLKQSSELAQQSAELAPMSDLGVIATCELLDVTGQTKKAIELLTQAMASGIDVSWRSYFMLGKLKAEQDSYDKVLGLLKQSLAFKESKQDIIVPQITAALRNQYSDDLDKLEEQLVSWNSMFPNPQFLETLASVMIMKKNFKGAERIYSLVIKEHPLRLETKVNLAILEMNFLQKIEKGLTQLKNIAQTESEHLSDEYLALIYSNIAVGYLELNNATQTEKYLIKVLNFANEEYALSVARSTYEKYNKPQLFVNFLKNKVDNIGGSGLAYALLGEVYSDKLNKPDDAINAYKNAISIDDKVSNYHNGLGLAYHKKSDFKTALKHFTNAVKTDPSDAIARYNLACMYSRLGKIDDALASIQEAFALSPNLIQTAQTDPDLQNIRSLHAFESIVKEVGSIDEDIENILAH